ncbi:MAG: class I SAM-dependent methyltransferase [Patescibacteria group bacterium]|jgi:ubiquinone/menaquinone biosynthesis C-methylase UbiE
MYSLFTKIFNKKRLSKYSDIVKNYEEYTSLQKKTFCSFESQNELWSKGQERYVKNNFGKTNRNVSILDIACGDGVGLREFKKLRFKNVIGVEFNHQKAILAKKIGYKVYECDMHDLTIFKDGKFDIIYSSHTIEHSYYPKKVITELLRILKPNGKLYVVLPYPDDQKFNIKAHGAKFELGTHKNDYGKSVIVYFKKIGFSLIKKSFDSFREPEIWLEFKK